MEQILYICGPTASDKTAFSIDFARALGNAVIINADTMQLYRGLEILAGHPDEKQQAQIEHRLFGILDLSQDFSRSQWLGLAVREIKQVLDAGKQPVLVGGSRSFAAELARAAYGISLDVDMDNAVTFPADENPVSLSLPAPLRVISLAPPPEFVGDNIDRRLQKGVLQALETVMMLHAHGYNEAKPGFWVLGFQEFSQFLEGTCTLPDAIAAVKEKAGRYANEQEQLFDNLANEIRSRVPENALTITATDPDLRLRAALDFVREINASPRLSCARPGGPA